MEVDNFLRILTTSPGGKVFVKENICIAFWGDFCGRGILGEPEKGKKEKGKKERGFIDILGWGSAHKRSKK
jgi:hypothetical protein